MAKNLRYRSLKGFRDLLPEETRLWAHVEERIRRVAGRYGFGEVRLPIAEETALFARGIGEGTDVVGKEMYSFEDRSDPPQSITLRPELTAGAARAWIEHAVGKSENLSRWYYLGPAFRYEQPQAGRYRQFSTFGVELIGSERPEAEVEVITMGRDLLGDLGITNFRIALNSLGTAEERGAFREALVTFLEERSDRLSEESRRRAATNPLRVLDSKDEADIEATADAPSILDFLGEESEAHFARVRELLDRAGVDYEVDPRLVRGLDYYSRTVFEYIGGDLGAQNALGGGGRYDGLIEEIGGASTPAIGFGFGVDRLILAVEAAREEPLPDPAIDLYLVALDDAARLWAVGMAAEMRGRGFRVLTDLQGRSMKAQMREANRVNAARVAIVGGSELEREVAIVKDMESSEQTEVPFARLPDHLSSF